jgi:TetR/AcrR family transcriptional regulator, transcriptional repressor of bet genes
MPRTVDRDQRRAELIARAAELIATHGIDGLTIRSVAKAAGVSTGVVSHYFSDKRDLLQTTYDVTADEVYGRVSRQATKDGPDVRTCLEGLLPLDLERQRGWRVWIAFWGLAIGDPEFGADQRARARRAVELVERILDTALARGELRPGTHAENRAAVILGVIQGIAAQTVFDPRKWPPERQKAALSLALENL